jgi:hypothetical protein
VELWSVFAAVVVMGSIAASVLLVIGLLRLVGGSPHAVPTGPAARARRHGSRTTAAMVGAGTVALVLTVWSTPLTLLDDATDDLTNAVATALIPTLVGLAVVGTCAVGETTWPRPVGDRRSARLRRRGVSDLVPRWSVRWTLLVSAVLLGVSAGGAVTRGVVHGMVTRTWTTRGGGHVVSSAGPYVAGAEAGLVVVAVALVLAGAGWTLVVIARRPAIEDVDESLDLALRRRSAQVLLRLVQLVVGVTAGGVLLANGSALRSVGLGVVGVPLLVLAAVVGIGSLAVLVTPLEPLPDGEPALTARLAPAPRGGKG